MKKETFSDKIIKRFYGIVGPLDEQKRQAAERMGNTAFIWLFLLLQVGNFFTLMLADTLPGFDARIYPIVVELLTLVLAAHIYFTSKKRNLFRLESELMTEKERRSFQHTGLKFALFFGISFHILFNILEAVNLKQNYISLLLDPVRILKVAIGASLLGLFIGLYTSSRKREADQGEEE